MKTIKKMTAEQKRIARNEYSRKWKLAHAKKVKQWNSAWQAAQKKTSKKKTAKKAVKKTVKKAAVVRKPKAPTVMQNLESALGKAS